MLTRFSRLFIVIAGILLCMPLAIGLWPSGGTGRSLDEERSLASWPALPRDIDDWRALPKALDAFVADHFGLRQAMIHLQSAIAYRWLREANPDVLIGRGGRLFYYGDEAIAQSAGETWRPDLIQHTIDVVTTMRQVLAERGIRLVVASPPNAASIYDDDLPPWARNPGRETEPEQILKDLKAHGLTVVDLRQVLRAARDQGNLYRYTDTHWTLLGALISYNAIVAAAGHSDWIISPKQIMAPPVTFDAGDLARMLGAGADLAETTQDWTIHSPEIQFLGPRDAVFQLAQGVPGGPAVFILGDSFSEGTFATLAAGHAGRIGWLHSKNCGFDWSWIASFKPDEVWWVPTERLMLCNVGMWPKGMPRPAGSESHTGLSVAVPGTHG